MHRRLGCLCPNYYFSFFYIDNFDYLLSSQQRLVKLMVSWTYIVSITELINPKLHPECIQLLDKSSSHRIWNGKEQNQIISTKEGKVHLGKRLGFTRRGECQKPRITSSFAPAQIEGLSFLMENIVRCLLFFRKKLHLLWIWFFLLKPYKPQAAFFDRQQKIQCFRKLWKLNTLKNHHENPIISALYLIQYR